MANIDILREHSRPLTTSSASPWGNFFNEFDSMFREFDRLLQPLRVRTADPRLAMDYDVEESDKEYILSCDLPGMKKDDIDVEVAGNRLTITGERKSERKKEGEKFYEKRFGKFQQSFNLPEDVATDKLEASYEDGVLYLAIPKAEGAKAKHISISEKGGLLKRIMGKKEESKPESSEAAS